MTIGLTGGIASGKTIVSTILKSMNYSVFNSDLEAKKIIDTNSTAKAEICNLLGNEAYNSFGYNKKFVAGIVFNNPDKLNQLNAIVHPLVRKAFDDFCIEKNNELVFNEAAILFETGAYRNFDKTILLVANQELRENRLKKRDNLSHLEVNARLANQWTDERKIKLADFVIDNNGKASLLIQINEILEKLNRI